MENFFQPLVSRDALINRFLHISRRIRDDGFLSIESEIGAGQTGVFKFMDAGLLMAVRGMTPRELAGSLRLAARSTSRRLEQRTDIWVDLLVWLNEGHHSNLYRYLRMVIMAMPDAGHATRELESLLKVAAGAWAPEIIAEPGRYWPEEFLQHSPGRECLEILGDGTATSEEKLLRWKRSCEEYCKEHAYLMELAVRGVLLLIEWHPPQEFERRLRETDFDREIPDREELERGEELLKRKHPGMDEVGREERILQGYCILLVLGSEDVRAAVDLPADDCLDDLITCAQRNPEISPGRLQAVMLLFQEMMMADLFTYESDEARAKLKCLLRDGSEPPQSITHDSSTRVLRERLALFLETSMPLVREALRAKIFGATKHRVHLDLAEQTRLFAREQHEIFQAVFRRWTALERKPSSGSTARRGGHDTFVRAAVVLLRLPQEHWPSVVPEISMEHREQLAAVLDLGEEFDPSLVEDVLVEFYYRALDEEIFELKDAVELRAFLDWYASPRGHFEQGWDFGPLPAGDPPPSDQSEFAHTPLFDERRFRELPERIMDAPGASPARIAGLLLPMD